MARVTGIGGIFFKWRDRAATRDWYREHLGIEPDPSFGGWNFRWRDLEAPERVGRTVWGPFDHDSDYFAPSSAPYMVNYRVDDLDRLLEQLEAAGVERWGAVEEYEYGRFAWIVDPEGTKIELWEPIGEEVLDADE